MKTLILYATKHGAAGEIAQRIADKLENATICDLKNGNIPSLAGYDCVIIGSSLYAGMIHKEVKAFLSSSQADVSGQKRGLFLCGLDESKEKTYFETNFPAGVLQTVKAAAFLGGIYDPKKANFIERLIMKMVAKQSDYSNTIKDNKIEQFVEAMKQ